MMLATCARLRGGSLLGPLPAALPASLPAVLPPPAAAAAAVTAPRTPGSGSSPRRGGARGLHAIYAVKSKRNVSSALPPPPQTGRTALYDFHVEHNGKMVPFAGFTLPVQYGALSIGDSHLHTRAAGSASLFDVSHMLQTEVYGKDRAAFMESLTTADVQGLAPDSGTLTVFTDATSGGILDDLIVCSTSEDKLFVVSNAGRRHHDQKLMKEAEERLRAAGRDVKLRFLEPDEQSLLALQGPGAARALAPLIEGVDLDQLYFMRTTSAKVAGVPCRVTRCGYTGEDGVEISMPSEHARRVAEALLQNASVKLAGLGARDSLRLEAGLCLYGSDIDITTTPIDAGLAWLVAKRRREAADFPGASVILRQLKEGSLRRRVGLVPVERGPPARGHTAIYAKGAETEDPIGEVTSGCPSPSLGHPIAIGYVQTPHHKIGSEVQLLVRNKFVRAKITKMPFVPSRYYMPPK
ncbi:Aminomethyltransferase, mitochondrial [Frankliniella fusca]|uniref:Aminomethyltransferase n=1 Tax=Frankliniella fusca TaxID=407009 RepID=A0AAE1LTU9_9NEOP|nr:Aminomethyltransferase, mitochondrial [Frankliniella fusca]